VSATQEHLQELLPSASPQAPPNLMPQLPAPPGVTTKAAPVNAVQGKETTAGQVNELLGAESPYVDARRQSALRYAASRGMQNSSLAAQAGEQAAIEAVLPIASETAGAYERRELMGSEIGAQERMQEAGFGHQKELQQAGFGHDTAMQAREIENSRWLSQFDAQTQEKLLGMDIGARERMQQAGFGHAEVMQSREIENSRWLSQFDAQTQEKLLGMDIGSRERMQAAGFSQSQALQAAEIETQRWLAQFDAGSRERLQALDADVRRDMQRLDVEAQTAIAGMNVAASSRSDAARTATTLELAYNDMLQTIMNNPDIPAETRQAYIDDANRQRESNIALTEQMFDIDLEW
jgi:hypothetical protein